MSPRWSSWTCPICGLTPTSRNSRSPPFYGGRSMPAMIASRVLALLLLVGALPAASEPFQVEGLPTPVEVSLPENHDPAKSWPAVFFYHGTGGHPTTKMIREQTGTKDWIVVGMAYTKPGNFTYTPENLEAELVILRRTRDALQQKYGLDPKRLYVSGFSMGGWMSGMFFQAERSLAGAVILGAGHMHAVSPKPPAYRPDTPLFIGVGRLDGTYPFALKAKLYFGKLGASLRMETWDGIGHEFPKGGSPGLKEWFALRNGAAPDNAAVSAEYGRITALPPLDQWRALLEFRERPFVNAPGQTWPETIKAKLAELEQKPDVAAEAKTFNRHRQLLANEINAVTLPDLGKVQKAYEVLVLEAGNGPQTALIAADLKRINVLLESFHKQSAERRAQVQPKPLEVPKSPRGDRQIPRNPMVK